MKDLPPFLRDTDLGLHFRSYHFDRENPNGIENQASTFGGWARYKSGWLFDVFGIGATYYGSARLDAPADKDGSGLLKPGREGYGVWGEAYAALRYRDYIQMKGYRQIINQPYITLIDNRMTPNTFEAITAGGKVKVVEYLAGYVSKIKPRSADHFVFMSQQAGAVGSDDGVILGSLRRDAGGGAAHRRRGAVRDQHLQHAVPGRRLPSAAQRELEAPPRRAVHGPARGGRRARARGQEETGTRRAAVSESRGSGAS